MHPAPRFVWLALGLRPRPRLAPARRRPMGRVVWGAGSGGALSWARSPWLRPGPGRARRNRNRRGANPARAQRGPEPDGAGTAARVQSTPEKRSAPQPGAGLRPPAKLGGSLRSAPAASRAGGSESSPRVPEAASAGAAEAAAGGGAGARRLRDGIDAAGEAEAGEWSLRGETHLALGRPARPSFPVRAGRV